MTDHPDDLLALDRHHARWAIVDDLPGLPLVIRDIGPWRAFPTVTNDAEHVVRVLHKAGKLPGDRRLLYYDSEGDLDELLRTGDTFTGFAVAGRVSQPSPAIDHEGL